MLRYLAAGLITMACVQEAESPAVLAEATALQAVPLSSASDTGGTSNPSRADKRPRGLANNPDVPPPAQTSDPSPRLVGMGAVSLPISPERLAQAEAYEQARAAEERDPTTHLGRLATQGPRLVVLASFVANDGAISAGTHRQRFRVDEVLRGDQNVTGREISVLQGLWNGSRPSCGFFDARGPGRYLLILSESSSGEDYVLHQDGRSGHLAYARPRGADFELSAGPVATLAQLRAAFATRGGTP